MANEIGKRDQNSAVVLMGITDDASQDIRMLRVDPTTGRLLVSGVGGGGGFTELPATGIVNGVNADFTFTEQPSYIIADGVWYKPTSVNGVTYWTWNGGTLTATLISPPAFDIWGVA